MRVPTPNVSVIDLKFTSSKNTSVEEINQIFIDASEAGLKNIINITEEKLVSIDLNHDKHSAIIAIDQTKVLNKRFIRVMAWYDNEWGFSHRMCNMAVHIGKLL